MQIIKLKIWCPLTYVLEEFSKDFESLCKVGSHSEQYYTLWHCTLLSMFYTLEKNCRTWHPIRWELVGIWTELMMWGQKGRMILQGLTTVKTKEGGIPWWSSDWESAFWCRGLGFDLWSRVLSLHILQGNWALTPWLQSLNLSPTTREACVCHSEDSAWQKNKKEGWQQI